MTYQEIKDRLSKCEITLEKLKNVTHSNKDVKLKTEKLKLLRESYLKLLKEADKGVIYTDDEKKAKDLADDGANVKLTVKERLKEQEGVKFSIEETKAIAKKVGQAVAKAINTVGDEIGHMKAKNIEENSFEIYIEYKNDAEDQFSFYIVDDTLHLVDFSFDKEISDVGVKPSGEALVNVDVVANELVKHFKSLNETEVSEAPEGMYYIKIPKDAASQNKAQVIFNDLYGIKYEINDDPKGIVMYFKKEDFDAGVIDDLEGDGVQILDTNVPIDEAQATSVADVIDPADYIEIAQNYLDGMDDTHNLSMDQLEDLGRRIVKQLYKGDFKAALARHGGTNVNETEVDTVGADLDVGHQDDEPNMLKKDLYDVITYAAKLYKQLDKYDQHDGEVDFPHWWQKKVTLAREYMSAAQHYLEGEEKQPAIDQLALENASSEEEEKFHKKLDTLVHNTFGKRKEEMDENRFLAASMEDLEQVIRNLAHTGEMSEDEAIELAIRKLEAMLDGRDDMDEGIAKTQKAHSLVVAKMKELAKQYKAGDKSVVAQLKDLTAKKKQLEKQLEKDVAGKNRGQQLDTGINEGRGDLEEITSIIEDRANESGFDVQDEAIEVIEAIADHYELGEVQFEYQNEAQLNEQATCCGKCGRVHVKGTKCKTPYLKGKDHCRTK